ncbi:MAG: hemerythrin domain-containing protein [Alphaproteobacteria bacterium]
MSELQLNRRRLLLSAGIGVAASALVTAVAEAEEEKEVGAVEDLMREHGILRRALIVYTEVADRLKAGTGAFDPAALNRTAKLFQTFGEDYHERKLEEAHIFPVVKKAGGPAAALPDILLAQHNRGREITNYILQVTSGAKDSSIDAKALSGALATFVRMYRAHAAREDTIVFPAWKEALTAKQLDELGDQFEDIEKQQFGGDGFDKAVIQIGEIEAELGLANLSQYTAPPPPHA